MRKMIERLFSLSWSIGFLLWLPAVVQGHTMWINATDYSPEIHPKYGAMTRVYFGWGHHYPVDDFLDKEDLAEFSLIGPDGEIQKLSPTEGGFLATKITLRQPGRYIVSAIRRRAFYTMYVERGETHHVAKPKTGLEGIILSLYYEQYAKCLIDLEDSSGISFSEPLGHRLEIVPLENPFRLHGCGGHFLSVKVLFEGKPASYCRVYATYSGFSSRGDFAYVTYTDAEGIARIRLTHWGPWLLKADMTLPVSRELADECNELHYTATLTFEIP